MSKSSGKPSLWQQAVGFVFFLGIGAACGYLIANYALAAVGTNPDASFPIVSMLLLLLCMYAAIFTQMVVHEAGHLVFGLLTGYGFSSFRIGSVMLLRQDGRLVFKQLSLAGTGGQCLMTPPEWRDGQIPFVLYNLGGSLMNPDFLRAVCAAGHPAARRGVGFGGTVAVCHHGRDDRADEWPAAARGAGGQ